MDSELRACLEHIHACAVTDDGAVASRLRAGRVIRRSPAEVDRWQPARPPSPGRGLEFVSRGSDVLYVGKPVESASGCTHRVRRVRACARPASSTALLSSDVSRSSTAMTPPTDAPTPRRSVGLTVLEPTVEAAHVPPALPRPSMLRTVPQASFCRRRRSSSQPATASAITTAGISSHHQSGVEVELVDEVGAAGVGWMWTTSQAERRCRRWGRRHSSRSELRSAPLSR
jgi:hypothetical protein